MKRLSSLFLLLVLLLIGGCNMLEWPAYVIFGRKEESVKAEYTGLKGQTTAILVSAGPGIDYEYPYARTNIALALAETIRKHVKDVEFIEQEKVESYQLAHLNWPTRPMEKIADDLGVDRILYLDLYQFTMHEENSVYLLRGHIRAGVSVYEADGASPNRPAYTAEVGIVWPRGGPEPANRDAEARIRLQSMVIFADALSKKFYDHKIPAR